MTPTIWIAIAIVTLIGEIFSGSFVLLMIAIAALIGSFASALSYNLLGQALVFLGTAICLVTGLFFYKRKRPQQLKVEDLNNLDHGHIVQVKWNDEGQGHCFYRGCQWVVMPNRLAHTPLVDGSYPIEKIDGTRIIVDINPTES
jgi:membrane protein implicated in regulation of membrane protease activity